MAGDSGKACTAVQAVFKRLRIQAFMPQQIQQRAGIEISGAGRAGDSTQRSERHGGVAAAAALDGADAAATPQMREDSAALQDSSVVAGHYAERGGKGEVDETVAADAQRIPCFRDRQAPAPGRERRVEVGVEGHALARVRPDACARHAKARATGWCKGANGTNASSFASTVSSKSAGVVQVTAMYDLVHHHVGAGPRLRQCLEQGGKALLRIHADWNFGPGAAPADETARRVPQC
ncbi:hypothetical protein RLIN73S_00156 [Rhodanobacter lindaniclasticus]